MSNATVYPATVCPTTVYPANVYHINMLKIAFKGTGGTFGSYHDRGGHCGHLAKKFLKKYCSYPELSRLVYRNLPVITQKETIILFAFHYT